MGKQEGIKLVKHHCPTVTKFICKPRKNGQNRLVFQNRYHLSEAIRKILIPSDKCSIDVSDVGVHLSGRIKKKPICPILSEKFGYLWTNETRIIRLLQSLHINISQRCSIVAMVSHKAVFNAGEVECLVILVVVILGAEVFIPVVGHILFEESYKVFEEFVAVFAQFIEKLATGDDDAPVGEVVRALAVLPEAVRMANTFALHVKKIYAPCSYWLRVCNGVRSDSSIAVTHRRRCGISCHACRLWLAVAMPPQFCGLALPPLSDNPAPAAAYQK